MLKELEEILKKWEDKKQGGSPHYIFSIEKEIEEDGEKRLVDDWSLEYELEEFFFNKYPNIQWKWQEIGSAVGCFESLYSIALNNANKLSINHTHYFLKPEKHSLTKL